MRMVNDEVARQGRKPLSKLLTYKLFALLKTSQACMPHGRGFSLAGPLFGHLYITVLRQTVLSIRSNKILSQAPRYPHTHPAALRAPGFWIAGRHPAGALGGVDMWITLFCRLAEIDP